DLGHRLAQHRLLGRLAEVHPQPPCSSSSTGRSTTRARNPPPPPLARGSARVEDETPSPSSPTTTKFSERRFGSSYRRTSRWRASGISSRNRSPVRNPSRNRYAPSLPAHTPPVAFPPLSPARVPNPRPSGSRTVSGGVWTTGAPRFAVGLPSRFGGPEITR